MDVWSCVSITTDGLLCARKDGDLGSADALQNAERVQCGLRKRGVSMHGRHTQESQIWMMSGK